MTARIHRLPSTQGPGDDGRDHEYLNLTDFAEREGVNRQTVYKWVRKHPENFPKGSLLLNPQGRKVVDYDLYKKGFTPVN